MSDWIPVSERLPEKEQAYLCAVKCMGFDDTYTKILDYAKDLSKVDKYDFYDRRGKSGWYIFDSEYGNVEYQGVVAWMPLPEPYEPQESDHKCHTCKHYTSGEHDGSCGSYICKGYSNWDSEG